MTKASKRALIPMVAGRAVLAACAVARSLAGHAQQGETLRQAVETALKTNPRVLAADALRRAAVHDLQQARGGYFPTLDVSAATGRERTESPDVRAATGADTISLNRYESGVVVNQNLFAGMATSSEVERQTARLNVATSRLGETREEIALRATEAFLEVLRQRELVRLSDENLKAHLTTQDKVRQRVEGGVGQKADLQQAMGRVALARSTASARAGRLREAEANFQAVMGRTPGPLAGPAAGKTDMLKSGAVSAPQLGSAIKQAAEAAAASNPSLTAANAEIAAAEASVRGAKAPYFPRLDFEVRANRNENIAGTRGNFNNETAMLVLRWNLFRGGSDRAQERALAERRYAAIDSAASTRRDIEERVAVALHAKATSEERLAYLEEHARLSREVLESYQQQLEIGRRTLLDVLNAENEMFTARSNLASGRYDDLFNQYAVEAAKGTLVKSLGIAPAE
jgi:adhesin transport system outer membrane protein